MMAQQSIAPFGPALLLLLVLGFLLRLWARRVAAGAPRWRWLPKLPVIGFVLIVLGAVGTVVGLTRSFAGLEQVEAAQKAQVLANGIALSMWSTAFFAGAGLLLYVVTGILCIALRFRRREPAP
jgi:hypothetical protein